ncbi:hypothetical protein BJ875DRAFT_472945 [Amylocarpus encephaloides]|uniref:Uncharacterized protein n=1 Tax=Amylocarpus encephaloides TaxID=45428 RepID=A0A9P7YAL4_9HELO|nr:hypothetical protein BJ875DRAFT_472945 [Amylocarpus encephaloides]
MYALRIAGSLIATAFLSNSASAKAVPRAENELNPWVSVDASGTPVATITPVLTTVNGVASTISPAPTSISTSQTDKKPTPTSHSVPTATGGGSFEVCNNQNGQFAPFCKPDNSSSVYVGETYYVTWDTRFFTLKNASVLIQANYVNQTDGGKQAFQSPPTTNAFGFYGWTIDKEWLRGLDSNNVTLFFVPLNPTAKEPQSFQGPTLEVTNRPKEYYHPPPTKLPSGAELYIALPTVFGFIVLCVVGGFFWNRSHRKIGLGNVMGRRGYGVGKSRTQRLGLGRKKRDGAILLREQELRSGPQYTDTPEQNDYPRARGHARGDSDALGSLAGTPTEERTNYFRDEMAR